MKPLPEREAPPAESPASALSRRAALQGLAGAVGAALGAATSAAEASPHPLEAHLAQRSRQPAATAKAPKPELLDAHHMALLTVIADLMVPGAAASGSPAFIDHVLAIERPEVQQRFIGALSAFDALARDRHQQPFGALARERQIALLEGADGEDSSAGRDLQHLKTWIAGAHFSSEPGMKALGFTGGMFFASFPACTHQDGHS
jgi:Gluconate 2-dehydrogenase subunit 3